MVCVNHRDREAVAQCSGCGAYICAECAQKSEPLKSVCGTLCPSCYRDKITQTRDLGGADLLFRQKSCVEGR